LTGQERFCDTDEEMRVRFSEGCAPWRTWTGGQRQVQVRVSAAHWIRSPAWDGLWIFGGLWAPVLSILAYWALRLVTHNPLALDVPGYDVQKVAVLYLPLSILHRISTTYAVVGTPILRGEIREHPTRYLYIPLAIVALCVGLGQGFAFHSAFAFMPSVRGELWAFFLLAYVMVLWERWHFSAQEFGVLSIYRIRARQIAPGDKKFDRFYTVVLMLGVNMVLFVWLGFSDERDILLYGTPPAWYRGDILRHAALFAFVVGMGTVAAALVREWRHPQGSLPKAMFYILIGAHTLLLYVFPKALGLFFLGYVFHHWMVAVGLFGRVTLASYSSASPFSAVIKLAVRVGPLVALVIVWYLFFAILDRASNLAVPSVRMFEGASIGAKIFAGVVIGLFFAVNYLHYYYDRCFYSLGNPAIRKSVGPLLFGPPAVTGPPVENR
jgi:hypothetical protein